jgi:hypothetical protein
LSEQREPWIEEEMRREEMRQQRARWEQERRERKAQQEREEKQARLQAYLKRRGEAYLDHVGSPPSQSTLEQWQMDYLAEIEAEEQRRRKAAIAEYDERMGF